MLTQVQQSQYGTSIFIIPNKEGTVRILMDYSRINQLLVRYTYPLSRIGGMMYQLESFHYETALDPNMIYYTIKIFPTSQDMMTIVT